jgi:hypothetical protein
MAAYEPISGANLGWDIPDFGASVRAARQQDMQQNEQRFNQMIAGRQQDRADKEMQVQQDQLTLQQKKYADEKKAQVDQARALAMQLREAGLPHQADIIEGSNGIQAAPYAPGGYEPYAPQQPQAPEQQGPEAPKPDLQQWHVPGPWAPGYDAPIMGHGDIERQMRRDAGVPDTQPSPLALDAQIAERQQQSDADIAAAQQWQAEHKHREAVAAQVAAYPEAMRQWEADMAAYHANPVVSYDLGNGRSAIFDPREKERATSAENERRAVLVMQALKADPNLAPYAATAGAMARVGLVDPKTIIADVSNMAKQAAEDKLKKEGSPNYPKTPERQTQDVEVATARGAGSGSSNPANHPISPHIAELQGMLKPDGSTDKAMLAQAAQWGISEGVTTKLLNDYHSNVGKVGREDRSEEALKVTMRNGQTFEAVSKEAATKARDAIIANDDMTRRLNALIDYVKAHRRSWTLQDTNMANSLSGEVLATKRKYEGLGVAQGFLELDKQIIGPTGSIGHGLMDFIRGGDERVLQHVLSGTQARFDTQMHTYAKDGGPAIEGHAPPNADPSKTLHHNGKTLYFDAQGNAL